MRDVKVMQSPELMVGVDFVLMGVDLSAYYHKSSNGYEIMVAPSVLENNAKISMADMIEQFNGLAGEGTLTEEAVKDKIGQDSNISDTNDIDWGSISFTLKMLFLNIRRDTTTTDNNVTEYAFSLQINLDGLIPKEITVINIHSLSFNIWNTQRQLVLEKMSLITPESF